MDSSAESKNGKKDAKKKASAIETFILLMRGFGLVFRSSPFLTPLIMIIGVVLALEPIANLWIMKLIVDRLTGMAFGGGLVWAKLLLRSMDFVAIIGLLGIQFAIWVATRGFRSFEDYLSSKAQQNFELHVKTLIMRKCADLDLAFFEDPKNLDHLEKASRGSSMSAWNLLWMLFHMVSSFLTMITFLGVLFMLSWVAPVVVIITTAPQMIASAKTARERWHIY